MNETLNTIMNRRSIRQYNGLPVAEADIKTIMEAALTAPSAILQQKWHFSVVTNKCMIERMIAVIKENIISSKSPFSERAKSADFNPFYDAPCVILISGDETARWVEIDCSLAAENILLAAASLDIASCIMAMPQFLFASEKGKLLAREVGVPEGYKFVCGIVLGKTHEPNPPMRPRLGSVVNYVR